MDAATHAERKAWFFLTLSGAASTFGFLEVLDGFAERVSWFVLIALISLVLFFCYDIASMRRRA